MVDAMHSRRHDERAEDAFEARGQRDVCVMEDYRDSEEALPKRERARRDAQENNLGHAKRNGEYDLDAVNAQSRRHIAFAIGVVHDV